MIRVAEFSMENFQALMDIESSSFHEPWNEKEMLYEINENPLNKILVLKEDDEVIGFIDYMITFNSSTISQIAIKNSFRKKGYASLLLEEMINRLPKSGDEQVETITLEVRKSNEAARGLYLKFGFEQVTEKKNYYKDGEDAIYMIKRLI